MPAINLIREKRQAEQKRDNQVKMAFVATLGAGAIALLVAFGFMIDAARLTLEANATEERKRQLKPLLEELAQNQAQLDELKPRLETLKTAQGTTLKWGNVMGHLTTHTPEGCWLTGLQSFQQDKTKPLQITFRGMSGTQDTIGEMIMKLQQSKDLEKVTFKGSSERTAEGNTKFFEFEIAAELAGSGQSDLPKEKTSA